MKSYMCDHCGKAVQVNKLGAGVQQQEELDKGRRPRGIGKPKGWVSVRIIEEGHPDTYDLCADCTVELENFLSKTTVR